MEKWRAARFSLFSLIFPLLGDYFRSERLSYMSSQCQSSEVCEISVLDTSFTKWRCGVKVNFSLFFTSWLLIRVKKTLINSFTAKEFSNKRYKCSGNEFHEMEKWAR